MQRIVATTFFCLIAFSVEAKTTPPPSTSSQTQSVPFAVPPDKLVNYCIYNNRIYSVGAVICTLKHRQECTDKTAPSYPVSWLITATDCADDTTPSPN